ncbi:MAG: hypothetical protein M0R21_04190 [Lentimicrobiaceae bacterium]|jgi:hypothetical protein|nr:hypothetical protein [Lentimicrobiaceae bacterium]
MKKTYLLIFLIVLFIISCSKEDNEFRLSDFSIPTINGYYQRDLVANIIGIVGTPNVRLGNSTGFNNSIYYFFCYPNPCSKGLCAIHIKAPIKNEIKKLWITPAYFNNQGSNNSIDLNNSSNIFIGGSPVFQTEFTSNDLTVNLSQIPNGYYRIYLKVNGYLLYDNLLIYKLNK